MQKPIHETHNSDSFEGAIRNTKLLRWGMNHQSALATDFKRMKLNKPWWNHFVLGVLEDESAFKESNCGCGFFLPREGIIPDKRGRWPPWIMETY